MADEDKNETPQDAKNLKKSKQHDSGAADLEKVTDYAEEKEISSSDITEVIKAIGERRRKEAREKLEHEKELAKVHIRKQDVELIERELEISKSKAERSLREYGGNLYETLISLSN